jgi:hypothetical protein
MKRHVCLRGVGRKGYNCVKFFARAEKRAEKRQLRNNIRSLLQGDADIADTLSGYKHHRNSLWYCT